MALSDKDSSFIAYLSNFLRTNENEVLVGKKKLSLTSSVLCILNKLYVDANKEISNIVISDTQLKENWNYLLNIINNVIALKVTHCAETVQGRIDLSMFKNLLMLELKKTPIHLFSGLDEFCSQLETLVCSCSISSLNELFTSRTANMEWTAMKQLSLAHNFLEGLEDGIHLFPNLEVIDVSHNKLIHADGLKFLSRLCVANLGFNNLSKVPMFSNESYMCLNELSLRNNSLEDLSGLENIRHIQDLDLSYNCLSDHSVLCTIENLPYLQSLKLVGNPFVVQRLHRILTAKYLHPNVLTFGIKLDGYKLSKAEIRKVVQVRSINKHNSINVNITQTNLPHDEASVNFLDTEILPVVQYPSSSSLDDTSTSAANGALQKDDTRSITSISSDTTKKKKSRVKKKKEIVIEDCGNSKQHIQNYTLSEEKDCKAQEFKETVTARRERLGQEWLVSTHASSLPPENFFFSKTRPFVNALGSQQTMPEHQDIASVSHHKLDNKLEDISSNSQTTNAPCEDVKEQVESAGEKAAKKISVASDDIEVICTDHLYKDEIVNDCSICKSCMHREQEDISEDDNFQNNENAYDIKYGITEEEKNPESNIFLVGKKLNDNISTTIFISIGEKYLNEKDVFSTDLLDSLDLSVLDNAEIIEKNIIKLEFKIFKVSKRERIYCARNETDAKGILSLLLPHAYDRNLKNIVRNALKCLKCDAQFSKNVINERFLSDKAHPLAGLLESYSLLEAAEFEDKDICPVCNSLMIVEDSDCPITMSLLQKANYSPSLISGYLATAATHNTLASSSSSTEFPSNLLLTFKHPPKVKNDTFSSVLSANGDTACHANRVNTDSDDSSVCTALEYTSQELAGNSSIKSLDVKHSNDNYCSKEAHTEKATDGAQFFKDDEDNETSMPEANNKTATACITSLQTAGNFSKDMVCSTNEITYDTFTNINHRLKLYVEMKLFDANEDLEASAEAIIVSHTTTVKNNGLLLLSNKKLHFMKMENLINDEPEKNITPLEAVVLSRLNTVLIFIGNQGVSFIWGTEKNRSECKASYTCLFRDADYCCSFITYFADFIKERVPVPPTINSSLEESLIQVKQEVLLAEATLAIDISTEILAFLLVEWHQLAVCEKQETVALILTSTHIHVANITFTKQNSKSVELFKPVQHYIPVAKQKLTNLISVHPHFDSNKIGLHFLDEDSNQELTWVFIVKTKWTLYLLINILKEPWQENFGIEMKFDIPVDCKCYV